MDTEAVDEILLHISVMIIDIMCRHIDNIMDRAHVAGPSTRAVYYQPHFLTYSPTPTPTSTRQHTFQSLPHRCEQVRSQKLTG